MDKQDAQLLGQRYLTMSKAYLAAAERLRDGLTEADLDPFYHCAAHSIELALKAVLLSQGDSVETMMRLNHNLDVCLRSAVGDGLPDPPSETWDLIAKLSWGHSSQSFRYPSYLSRDLPDPVDAISAATSLLRLAAEAWSTPEAAGVQAGSGP